MPLTPPDPLDILETLRAASEQIRAYDAAHPGETLPEVALDGVLIAEKVFRAIAHRGASGPLERRA